ncbi:HalOD1 output domain-containing protein [Natronosalvus caseinilyticus]|uniref:HalOD1 output domain-containing protein n=1 Tax=Natronosalvus caseinilyticus TaxID=2953747 RepID=UPI0028AF4672|nr:HalOD1 output domain-containing protein [Natronosalvus caseinilyticus]
MDSADDSLPPSATVDRTKRTHTESFDPTEGPVETIVDLVAAASGRSLVEMPPIYEVIDPDALNALFRLRNSGADLEDRVFEFTYEGYRVSVHGDGRVRLTEPTNPAKVTEPLE